jgi:hypothetical protein
LFQKLLANLGLKVGKRNFIWRSDLDKNFSGKDYRRATTFDESYEQLFIDHLEGKNVLHAKYDQNGTVLLLDIDVAEDGAGRKVGYLLRKIKLELGNHNPFFIEHNPDTGSVHVAWRFTNPISQDNRKAFADYINDKYGFKKKYGITVDALTHGHIRLPNSGTYQLIRYWHDDNGRKYYLTFDSDDDAYKFYEKKYRNQSIENNDILHASKKPDRPKPGNAQKIYQYGKFTRSNHVPTFSMSRGQRHENHVKLGYFCMSRGLSYEKFFSLSIANNCGSKDLTNTSDSICRQVWSYCQRTFDPEKYFKRMEQEIDFSGNFHYNTSFSFGKNEEGMRRVAQRIAEKEFTYKVKEKAREIFILLRELYGKLLYNAKNVKSFLNRGYNFLHGCVSVGKMYLRRLKKALGLTGVERLMQAIINSGVARIERGGDGLYYKPQVYAKHVCLMPQGMASKYGGK